MVRLRKRNNFLPGLAVSEAEKRKLNNKRRWRKLHHALAEAELESRSSRIKLRPRNGKAVQQEFGLGVKPSLSHYLIEQLDLVHGVKWRTVPEHIVEISTNQKKLRSLKVALENEIRVTVQLLSLKHQGLKDRGGERIELMSDLQAARTELGIVNAILNVHGHKDKNRIPIRD